MNLILLTGDSESGKDFVADYLVRWFGCSKISLATPIKELVASHYKITLEELEVLKNDDTSLVRGSLQEVGQSALIKDPNVWVKAAWDKITTPMRHFYPDLPITQSCEMFADSVVISDVRQVNEVLYFISQFGRERVRLVSIERELDKTKAKYKHPVEQGISQVKLLADHIYHNDVLLPEGFTGRFAGLDTLGYLVTRHTQPNPYKTIFASSFKAKSLVTNY